MRLEDSQLTAHVAHLLRVPFENPNIHMDRPISLAKGDRFHKIVEEKRGGFCYEQNLLFAAPLRAPRFVRTMGPSAPGSTTWLPQCG